MFKRLVTAASIAAVFLTATSVHAAPFFIPGNLVVAVEGAGVRGAASGPYADNAAAPITLFQYSHAGTASAAYVNSLVLPQNGAGAISGEYGSSSEGFLQRSGDGRYLTIAGYGVNAATFNANPTSFGTAINDPTKPTALGQSGSLTGQGYTPVARVAALIGADGSVDTSTQITGIYNGNNPRSVYSADGSSFYLSGQGISGDTTGGVYLATLGAHSATPITGNDSLGKTVSQDTRFVTQYNGQTYVSVDSKQGSGNNRDFIGTLGAAPTGLYDSGNGPTRLPGFGNSGGTGKVVLTAGQTNGINSAGQEINLSPEQYFFANATTLYVADAGMPKNDSASNSRGDGGLQKWVFGGGQWSLAYTLADGLNLVRNNQTAGTTGLFGLAGQVVGGNVQLFATNYTIGDIDQTYLYGITDILSAVTRPVGESFVQLDAAPVDSKFRGLSFAPEDAAGVPEPATYALLILGVGLIGAAARDRRRVLAA